MLIFSLALLATLRFPLTLALPKVGNPIIQDGAIVPPRACGVPPPDKLLLANHHSLAKAEKANKGKRDSTAAAKINVKTYFHVVTTQALANSITRTMVANQFGELQSAYANSSISFTLMNVSYTSNDTWATDAADDDMKAALRRGTYADLNIYYQTNLSSSPVTPGATQLLGYCTLPSNVTYQQCPTCPIKEFPPSAYHGDGCNILAGSMPGGTVTGYNLGKTSVHEVGHWFGLLHTFQDNTCNAGDVGDYIDDTAQESVSTDGCPVGKNSCPNSPGDDPVHNFMDYSTDRW